VADPFLGFSFHIDSQTNAIIIDKPETKLEANNVCFRNPRLFSYLLVCHYAVDITHTHRTSANANANANNKYNNTNNGTRGRRPQ
jgi:hypothetical protein